MNESEALGWPLGFDSRLKQMRVVLDAFEMNRRFGMSEWRKEENVRSLMLQYGMSGNQNTDQCGNIHASWR